MNATTVDEMLQFAMEREESAARFYEGMAEMTESKAMRAEFKNLATQEWGHKARIEKARTTDHGFVAREARVDLKVSTYLKGVEPRPGMSYEDLLVLAIHREAQAVALYADLAAKVPEGSLQNLLLALVKEETEHKHHFEMEYDDKVLAQN